MVVDPSLITVRTDVVMQVLVPSLHAAAAERAEGEGEAWLESMGWHAREVELERFAPARDVMPWLAEMLAERVAGGSTPAEAAEEVSRELAAAEPEGRPEPGEFTSWRVPGPGGHVRHFLALAAARETGSGSSKTPWLTGFFRHCCAEAQALP